MGWVRGLAHYWDEGLENPKMTTVIYGWSPTSAPYMHKLHVFCRYRMVIMRLSCGNHTHFTPEECNMEKQLTMPTFSRTWTFTTAQRKRFLDKNCRLSLFWMCYSTMNMVMHKQTTLSGCIKSIICYFNTVPTGKIDTGKRLRGSANAMPPPGNEPGSTLTGSVGSATELRGCQHTQLSLSPYCTTAYTLSLHHSPLLFCDLQQSTQCYCKNWRIFIRSTQPLLCLVYNWHEGVDMHVWLCNNHDDSLRLKWDSLRVWFYVHNAGSRH